MELALEMCNWVTSASVVAAVVYFVREYSKMRPRWWRVPLGRALVMANIWLAVRTIAFIACVTFREVGFAWMRDMASLLIAGYVVSAAVSLKRLR